MSYFIEHSKKNEKHVKASDSDQHVTQKLLTLKGLIKKMQVPSKILINVMLVSKMLTWVCINKFPLRNFTF